MKKLILQTIKRSTPEEIADLIIELHEASQWKYETLEDAIEFCQSNFTSYEKEIGRLFFTLARKTKKTSSNSAH